VERWYKATLCAVSVIFVVVWAKPQYKASTTYQTVVGTGPDKWASVWLVRSYLNPDAVTIAVSESDLTHGVISFDTGSAEFTRTGTSTTYSALLAAHAIADPVAVTLGKIIHDIEINAWNPNREVESLQVENAFRQMQLAFGRDKVTQPCYMAFFAQVARTIKQVGITLDTDTSQLIPTAACLDESEHGNKATVQSAQTSTVPELDLTSVLNHMSTQNGVQEGAQQDMQIGMQNKVVFVDTREAFEFAEGHIPGAVNFTLRELDSTVAATLAEADLVVAYCVKDFRGFEAARKLRKYGVNAVIMNPYGIKGWRNAGLPIAGSRGMSESDANDAMQTLLKQHLNNQTEAM